MEKAARHNIPRECQKECIPGLSDESSDLLKLYDEQYHKYPLSESTSATWDETPEIKRDGEELPRLSPGVGCDSTAQGNKVGVYFQLGDTLLDAISD